MTEHTTKETADTFIRLKKTTRNRLNKHKRMLIVRNDGAQWSYDDTINHLLDGEV